MSPFLFQSCPTNDDAQDQPKLRWQKPSTNARRNRQQRYREKQRQYADRLEDTVKRLRMDVDQRLITRRNIQRTRFHDCLLRMAIRQSSMTASDIVSCMRECMKTFESGVRDQQMKFLESATCSDVRYGEHVGREYILEQWTAFALVMNGAGPMLEHCEFSVDILDSDVAVGHVSAVLAIRLTRRSLANRFPHTLSDSRLRDRLLEYPTIRLPMSVLFQFDEQGKICRYDPTIDFVTGLYEVIRDFRDVASILESATIDGSGHIRGGLPFVTTSQLGLNLYSGCRRSTHVDKHSVAFLLSSNEDTRRTTDTVSEGLLPSSMQYSRYSTPSYQEAGL